MIEVSLSKEERRIVDEYGNSASTWARIGITAELEDGDLPENCIKLLKEEIQPQVDDWLLRQGGYLMAPGETIEEVEERLGELFGTEVKVSEVSPDGDDDIPL
jgi:hypothetical protein